VSSPREGEIVGYLRKQNFKIDGEGKGGGLERLKRSNLTYKKSFYVLGGLSLTI